MQISLFQIIYDIKTSNKPLNKTEIEKKIEAYLRSSSSSQNFNLSINGKQLKSVEEANNFLRAIGSNKRIVGPRPYIFGPMASEETLLNGTEIFVFDENVRVSQKTAILQYYRTCKKIIGKRANRFL